ncbi:MAG: DNA alkylation repair protein [Alphaproteobacteria bacterium]|nr:DNA alkylation repair protein [Alphaproteobacteria bacterium]
MSALAAAVQAALQAAAVPADAEPMRAYMKSEMPFWGVKKPARSAAQRPVFATWKPADAAAWRAGVADVWDAATHREQRYAAIDLLLERRFRALRDADSLALMRRMVVEGAWWDVVDPIAVHGVGGLLAAFPAAVRPTLWAWATDADPWLRRTAILCQNRHRQPDWVLFDHAVEASLDDPDFFLRKAIGWALREHGDRHPQAVVDRVARWSGRISPLSRREALRKQWARGEALALRE